MVGREPSSLVLYEYLACPFCMKVRRVLRRKNLNIERRNVKKNPDWAKELRRQGGKSQVPCLKITTAKGDTKWLYESDDIIAYLDEKFPDPH